MVESPSSPIVCAPVVPSTSSTEAPMESSPPRQPAPPAVFAGNPNPTTPSQEVHVAGLPDTSVATTVAPSEVHSTQYVPSSEFPTRGVIHIPPTSGKTP
ncbi:hypothetical protein P9112_006951 [Eukaryota sp. TZLM1-RC]